MHQSCMYMVDMDAVDICHCTHMHAWKMYVLDVYIMNMFVMDVCIWGMHLVRYQHKCLCRSACLGSSTDNTCFDIA